jgi:RNA polymerase sigma-B factor
MEDLAQVALLGLVKAVDRFDPGRGVTFATYAIPTVLGELRRYFRDCGWAVRVPRREQERALAIREAERQLSHESGRAPTVNQLAEFLELDVEQVLDGMQAMNAYSAGSLEAPGEEAGYAATVGREDENYSRAERRMLLSPAMRTLSPRDLAILRMRFAEELSQSQIGARLGISQMQVSRLLRRIFRDLQNAIEHGTGQRPALR